MKKIIALTILLAATLGSNAQTNFADLSANGISSGKVMGLNASATTGNMTGATNIIHGMIIPFYGDYTIGAGDTNAFWTTNVIYVNYSTTNCNLNLPPVFINTFNVLNLGAVLTNVATSGTTFLVYPLSGGIIYSANLMNLYLGKAQTFQMANKTNIAVVGDFRPLSNIVRDVTNNLPNLSFLANSNGAYLSGVVAASGWPLQWPYTAITNAPWQTTLTYQPATNGAGVAYSQLTGIPYNGTNGYSTNSGTAANLSGNISESQVTSLISDLSAKQGTLGFQAATNGANVAYSQVTGAPASQTQWPQAAITNAQTQWPSAAITNAPWQTSLTYQPATNGGNILYSQLPYQPLLTNGNGINLTNIAYANLTGSPTAQTQWPQSSITNATIYDALNAALNATNGLGSSAFKATSFFDLSGAALNATNGLGASAFKPVSFFDLAGVATAATNGLPATVWTPQTQWPMASVTNATWLSANQTITVSGDYSASGATMLAITPNAALTNRINALSLVQAALVSNAIPALSYTLGTASQSNASAFYLAGNPSGFISAVPVTYALKTDATNTANSIYSNNLAGYISVVPVAYALKTDATNAANTIYSSNASNYQTAAQVTLQIASSNYISSVPITYALKTDSTNAANTAALNATNGLGTAAFKATSFFDLAGVAQSATNGLGTSAFKATGFFDLSGAATTATNGLPVTVWTPQVSWPQSSITNATVYDALNAALNATNNLPARVWNYQGTNNYATNSGTAAALTGNIIESQVTSLVTDLSGKQPTLGFQAATNGASILYSQLPYQPFLTNANGINLTNIPYANLTGTPLTQTQWPQSAITNATVYDAPNAALNATNGLGSSAFKATSFFDLSNAALNATNGLPATVWTPQTQWPSAAITNAPWLTSFAYQPATNGANISYSQLPYQPLLTNGNGITLTNIPTTASVGTFTNNTSGNAGSATNSPNGTALNFLLTTNQCNVLVSNNPSRFVTNNTSANFATMLVTNIISTNGYASFATNQLIFSSASTISNSQTINMTVYITAATALSMTNGSGQRVFSGANITAFTPIILQPKAVLMGTAITCIGTNGF